MLDCIRQAEAASVPVQPLLDKIKEGAAKGIQPARLLQAAEDELDRLNFAGELLDRYVKPPLSPNRSASAAKDISIVLLGGLSRPMLERLFTAAQLEGKTVETTFQALHTLLEIASVSDLAEEELSQLGEQPYSQAALPAGGYDSLVSVFLKAGSRRLSGRETVEIIREVLSRGGGLLQIEGEMNRRSRRR